jgi:hypothetical protein
MRINQDIWAVAWVTSPHRCRTIAVIFYSAVTYREHHTHYGSEEIRRVARLGEGGRASHRA